MDLHIFDCLHPRLIKNRYTGNVIQIPCGECFACKYKRITQHVPSLIRESLSYHHTFFVTLTYDNKFLPTVNLNEYEPKNKKDFDKCLGLSLDFCSMFQNQLPVCKMSDIQNFIKRLREHIFRQFGLRNEIRYFFSGDYGSTLFRPHYHGLIFCNDKGIAELMPSLVSKSWSVFDLHSGQTTSMGLTSCEAAYGAAQYVSAYVNSMVDCPSIYQSRDFRPKCIHSTLLGASVPTLESPSQIVNEGLTEITIYNPTSYAWQRTALLPNIVRRLFPSIPSFSQLSKAERLSVYRFFYPTLDCDRNERLGLQLRSLFSNKFVADYLSLGYNITFQQLIDKLDRVHYIVKQLYSQCSVFDCSVSTYDDYIFSYLNNRRYKALIKQLNYEENYDSFPHTHTINEVLNAIDISSDIVIPSEFDKYHFNDLLSKYNKVIKRKCNNAYLDKHPEFKKFHS